MTTGKRMVAGTRKANVCFLTVAAVMVLSGCYVRPARSPLTGSYYLNKDKDLKSIGRVALVELDNHSSYPEVSHEATQTLFVALQKKRHFGISTIAQSDPRWRGLQLEPDTTYATHELVQLREALGCDAVLSGAVTDYQPYPHLLLGLRLRMIDLKDGALIWAVEHVWDGTDARSKKRASYYFQTRLGKETVEQELLQMSTTEFMKFAAFEIADTLSARFAGP